MENLNAEQVKKALECCTLGDCTPCPYHQIYVGCRDRMAEDALALINSYEQRIKDLENEVREAKLWADTYKEHHDIMDCECSRLEKVNEELSEDNKRLRSEVSVKKKLLCKAETRIEVLEEAKKQLEIDNFNANMNLETVAEENERLKNRITCQVILPEEKMEEIKNECLERVELDVKAVQADTLEEYRKRVYRKMEKYTIFGREYMQRIMREVAKEMLEDGE